MKNFRIISVLMTAMLCVFASCEKEAPVSVEFRSPAYQLNVGETMDIIAELVVRNTDVKPVFSSSDAAVAVVDGDGKLAALAQGEAVIKAVVEGKEATCTVSVSELTADNIMLKAPESLPADQTWEVVTASVEPAGYNTENLEWTFTPSHEGLEFETEKVKATEYRFMFKTFVEGGKLKVMVSDRNSDKSATVEIAVTEKIVPAERIALEMPEELTEGEDQWAEIKAVVTPEEYDAEHLVWEFEPSSPDMGFRYERVSATEYKICFASYVPDGFLTVTVSDELSEVFNQGRIKVLEKPLEGLRSLSLSPSTLSLNVGDEPVTLQVVYEPADYDRSLLEWTSSDEKVVTFADGLVTVVGEGEAVVKVKDTISGKEASCTVTVTEPVKEAVVHTIALSASVLELRVGEEAVQLVARCYDEEGNIIENYAGLEWSADRMPGENGKEIEVVEVTQQGVVTPKNPGSTQITVIDKAHPQVKAICNVTVKAAEIKVEEVKLIPDSKVIDMEQSFTLTAVIVPENAENKTLTYVSSDPAVAAVTEEGLVTGIKPGKTVITATAANGVKGECAVTVAEETWVYLSSSEMTLVVGEEKTLTATVTPENAPDKTVTWTSSDPEVATVEDGKVTGIKEGKAVITASANGKSAECKVTVEPDVVDFDITISPVESKVLTRGLQQDKSVKLIATYRRTDNDKDYVPTVTGWKSSDETVATVDSEGNVTAVAEVVEKYGLENGLKVTITHTADHVEQPFEMVVVRAQPEKIVFTALPSVDGVEGRIMHGETFRLETKVLPEKATQEVQIMWARPDGSYGGVLTDGQFHADIVGTYALKAYVQTNDMGGLDGIESVQENISIEVLPVKMTGMTMNSPSLEMTTGGQATLDVNITPSNASFKAVEWSSSDEAVATVNQNGTVTAVAAGTATVTAYQKENDMTATCTVTVVEPVTEVKVGDYYYSDGTTSATLKSDKTVIGVVFSLNNPSQMGDARLAEEYPDCTHGYVVSLVEYADMDFGSVSTYDGHGYYAALEYDANLIVDVSKANGYGNTWAHEELNRSKPDYCILFNETDGVVATHSASVQTPSGASTWYVPSYKEMQMMNENRDAVNAAISAAGGTGIAEPHASEDPLDPAHSSDWYWTSTIYGTWYAKGNSWDHHKYPFDISNDTWTSKTHSSAACKVRIILAF